MVVALKIRAIQIHYFHQTTIPVLEAMKVPRV